MTWLLDAAGVGSVTVGCDVCVRAEDSGIIIVKLRARTKIPLRTDGFTISTHLSMFYLNMGIYFFLYRGSHPDDIVVEQGGQQTVSWYEEKKEKKERGES